MEEGSATPAESQGVAGEVQSRGEESEERDNCAADCYRYELGVVGEIGEGRGEEGICQKGLGRSSGSVDTRYGPAKRRTRRVLL